MHPRRGHDLKFEDQFVSTACVVRMRCMHSVFSTHAWQAAHPVLEQSRIEGRAVVADRGEIQGPIHASPSGSLPRPFGPRGSVLVKIASRQHISVNCWSGFCAEYRRIILARRLPRCRRHRSRLFAHRVLYLTKRVVRGPERGSRTVAQIDTNRPRCTSSSGPWRRWLNKSPRGVADAVAGTSIGMRSATTRTSRW